MDYFSLQQEIELSGIESTGYLYEHKRTKARVCILKNADENKVFSISFRTPPEKSNGVAHIIEHSVLNGSVKYPIKDPFIQLGKSSLNTFLNAMTSPDKTTYPVASCNLKDFHNLMDVYMDAVFHPNIYQNSKIFDQEGWHYELLNEDEPITIKGVVYNEMKGAFSTPEQLLNRNIQTALFPNHPYGNDSGGIPEEIPDLTYEDFLDFHRKHYHPSNSYIFYCGDIDVEAELSRLHGYLEGFDYQKPETEIPAIIPWAEPKEYTLSYPLLSGENPENKAFFSLNYCMGLLPMEERLALSILEYLLLDAPGALLKERLTEKGLGEDIYGFFDSGIRESTFSITAKNIAEDRKQEFFDCVYESLTEIVKQKIEPKKLQAAINVFEFRLREADFGSMPKGIIFNFQILENWLYDQDPFAFFEYDQLFEKLRKIADQGGFEHYLEKYLIDNPYHCFIVMTPSTTMAAEKERELTERLAKYKAELSAEEIRALIQRNQELLAYQSEADSKEALATIPTLELSDIQREKSALIYTNEYQNGIHTLYHPANTSGIVYLKAFFEANWIREEQVPVVSLLASYLTSVSSKNYHYSQLSDEINEHTGGISTKLCTYNHKEDSDHFRVGLELKGKSFIGSLDKMLLLFDELLADPKFEDTKRLSDLIKETASQMQMNLVSGGHASASTRALSYYSKNAYFDELSSGISFYEFIQHWKQVSDNDLLELGHLMKKTLAEIMTKAKLTIAVTYAQANEETVRREIAAYIERHQQDFDYQPEGERNVLGNLKEAFITSGNVNYVAKAMNYKRFGYVYSGSFAVANNFLNTDYLWNKVRVEGGAYGGMSAIRRSGDMILVSYRDPNLADTYQVYEGIVKYFAELDVDTEEVKNAIIGTISGIDAPLTPSMENAKILGMYFSELTHEDEQKTRTEILDTTPEDIRKMSKLYEQVLSTDFICTVGTQKSIEQDGKLFAKIREIR
ncbi:insulinase family protein [Clostridiales bacterium COT073_COT-073]|nr:insulinase family protein [Clostridiales bacterium COT073_COT-073]